MNVRAPGGFFVTLLGLPGILGEPRNFALSGRARGMEITFWGTRGSIAAPGPKTVIFGGNTTCLQVTLSSGRTVVIDAGTGMRNLGDVLASKSRSLELYLLMTHVHWDHLMGFPFFAPLFQDRCHIILDGSPKGLEGLKNIFGARRVDGTWPISFEDLKAKIEHRQDLARGPLRIDDTIVDAHRIQHPQGGMGFKFSEKTGTFVFLTDNELREDGWKNTCFKDFVEFCSGTDLLVHDCQYFPNELLVRKGWGHSDTQSVAELAVKAEVGRLILFHHDPWRTDEGVQELVSQCSENVAQLRSNVPVEAATEGTSVRI